MKVYFAPQSRAARTVWLLEEIGLPYELEKFQLGQKEMRSPGYIAKNPNGRVPTLVDGDVTINESTAITQYLAGKYAPAFAPGPEAQDFANYLKWLQYAEGMIMPQINNYVVETILLPPERRDDKIAVHALKLLNRTLVAVEQHMEGWEFLAERFTIADTITGHAIITARRFDSDFSTLPNLSAYANWLESRLPFQSAEAA